MLVVDMECMDGDGGAAAEGVCNGEEYLLWDEHVRDG